MRGEQRRRRRRLRVKYQTHVFGKAASRVVVECRRGYRSSVLHMARACWVLLSLSGAQTIEYFMSMTILMCRGTTLDQTPSHPSGCRVHLKNKRHTNKETQSALSTQRGTRINKTWIMLHYTHMRATNALEAALNIHTHKSQHMYSIIHYSTIYNILLYIVDTTTLDLRCWCLVVQQDDDDDVDDGHSSDYYMHH